MRKYCGLDYETYSDVNLPEKGLHNYVTSPSFKPLIASVSTADHGEQTFDFVMDEDADYNFKQFIDKAVAAGYQLVAHNAGFERAVLKWMGLISVLKSISDSAVYARMLGAGEKLEVASRQLTSTPKLVAGGDLIQLFCVPNARNKNAAFTADAIRDDEFLLKQWMLFIDYCEIDAKGSREIAEFADTFFAQYDHEDLLEKEDHLEYIAWEMNQAGWHIDRPLIEQMSHRSWANTIIEKKKFFTETDSELNFKSPKQLQKYCADRNFPIKSLNKYVLPSIIDRAEKLVMIEPDNVGYQEVLAMLYCKVELGGSTLSKLQRILDLAGDDDILRDQYVHNGAGQTYRTSAKGVQMQNLKKLGGNIRDMSTMYDYNEEWTNTDISNQLRQVFTSRDPMGSLVVADFSAVESRGLAYLAGEEWKLDAYRKGLDVYKVLVTKYLGIEYDEVTAEQRPRGKYSELSCGYQASGKAVQEFMFRLGFVVDLDRAKEDVIDWRSANSKIVDLWYRLDDALKDAARLNTVQTVQLPYGQRVRITPFQLYSIQEQHPGATSLLIQLTHKVNGVHKPFMSRILHGTHFKNNSLCYYKPAERLSESNLWSALNKTASQKAGREILLSVYGGKLAGILTQSLCREIFFDSMAALSELLQPYDNAVMVGQFHDEIVVDWWPEEDGLSKQDLYSLMEKAMSYTVHQTFPLAVEVKSGFRYIK